MVGLVKMKMETSVPELEREDTGKEWKGDDIVGEVAVLAQKSVRYTRLQ